MSTEEMVTMTNGQGLGKTTKSVPLSSITHFVSDMKYVEAHFPGGMLILSVSLAELEKKHAESFVRCHRKALVSKRHIKSMEVNDYRYGFLSLDGVSETIPVSRRHKTKISALLLEQAHA